MVPEIATDDLSNATLDSGANLLFLQLYLRGYIGFFIRLQQLTIYS